MYEEHTVGVVVPAYNEEGNVARVIETVPPFVDRIYAVDDASTDGTWSEIRRAAARTNGNDDATPAGSPPGPADATGPTDSRARTMTAAENRVVALRHRENRGVGGAIKSGYLAALEDGVDVVAVMGGDGQMDPARLQSIVDPVVEGTADYAKGNRFLAPETRAGVPRFRYAGNLLLSFLAKVASGYWAIGDSMNGYTAISRHALEEIDLEAVYESYGFCNDMLVRLNVEDLTVADVPAPIDYGDETSHIDYATFVPLGSLNLLENFLWRLKETYVLRDFHPLVLLYGLGAFGGAVALAQALDGRRGRDSGATTVLLAGIALALAMVFDREYNEHLAERVEP